MKFIIGKKLGMTQVWQGDKVLAVTKVQAGPCFVAQVKDAARDGYEAVQIGYGEKKAKKTAKPQKGHLQGLNNFRYLKEFRTVGADLKRGDKIDVNTFAVGDIVDVVGTSKGKGFQGVVKRHGFHGHPTTHGTKDAVRMPGSIGSTGPAHVFKGTRMGGHMGDERVTVKNLEVVQVDAVNNLLFIKGAVPGAVNGLLLIAGNGDLVIAQEKSEPEVTEEKNKEINLEENIEKVVIEAEEKRESSVASTSVENMADKNTTEDKEKMQAVEEEKPRDKEKNN